MRGLEPLTFGVGRNLYGHYAEATAQLDSYFFLSFSFSFISNLISSPSVFFKDKQCDQIWRFFALWATIQSLWQQLF